ncbi:MAG: hypothetical protein OEU84_11725 [Xanthomonadales bacterium]|nr:hypothetical protein [Xanthomonadales bacterium]
MIKRCYLTCLLALMVLLSMPVYAQDNEPVPPPETDPVETPAEDAEVPASQEVEINEDNYRQFMELKDANRQRNIIPENVFKPDSGLQKLEKLPEKSQKHLRNQLREIIVQGDEWKPGDEETDYPYTPSKAASTDPSLAQQEKEAWGELVDSYHQRESQIYENSSGSQSAMGSEQGSSNAGNGPGTSGESGQSGEGSQGQQAGQEGNPDQSDTEGTYSLNGSSDSSTNSTAGVSQNAMEFLQGLGQGGSGTGEGNSDSPGNGGQGDSPTPSEAQSQAQTGQQDGSETGSALTGNSPTPPRDPNARSTAGASQNAMEFLKGASGQGENAGNSGTDPSQANGGQSGTQGEQSGTEQSNSQQPGQDQGQQDSQSGGQENAQKEGQDAGQGNEQANGQDEGQGEEGEQSQDGQQAETAEESEENTSPTMDSSALPSEPEEESTAGASQNALEYLTGDNIQAGDGADPEQDSNQAEGTLSLQDLLNAQGVGDTTGTGPAATSPDNEQPADQTKPKKDGDG